MNKKEFLDQMDRVLCFWQRPEQEKQAGEFKDYEIWLDEIYKKVSWIQVIRFPAVIDALLEVRPRYRKDLDHRRIVAVYNDLALHNGWIKQETRDCGTCRGFRFVHIWVRDPKGHEFKATKGCANCNKRYSTLHSDFTEIDMPEEHRQRLDVEKLKSIPPDFAKYLLTVAERTTPAPKEEILDALVLASCQPDPKDVRSNRFRDDAKRKNELVRNLVETPVKNGEAEREQVDEGRKAVAVPTTDVPDGSSPPLPAVAELTEEDLKEIPF